MLQFPNLRPNVSDHKSCARFCDYNITFFNEKTVQDLQNGMLNVIFNSMANFINLGFRSHTRCCHHFRSIIKHYKYKSNELVGTTLFSSDGYTGKSSYTQPIIEIPVYRSKQLHSQPTTCNPLRFSNPHKMLVINNVLENNY